MLHYLKFIFDEVDWGLKHKKNKKHFDRYHVHRSIEKTLMDDLY